MLRLILAGLFAYLALMASVGILSRILEHMSVLGFAMTVFAVVVSLFGALVLFNRWDTVAVNFLPANSAIPLLRRKGILVEQSYKARRALKVEESDDEGPHYFVEMEDGAILYVSGQYLYDYEPSDAEDDEPARARRFPNREFSVLRNERDKAVRDIQCTGEVMDPERTFAFPNTGWPSSIVHLCPEDGAILKDGSFDGLVQALANSDRQA